jgi:Mn-dependent DtxR family transcriptional regulator
VNEPTDVGALTDEERDLIRLLRHEPQSVTGVAEALRVSPEQTQAILQRLDRKVGLVRLFRYDTLRYGLPE